jgi:hypothetical protein
VILPPHTIIIQRPRIYLKRFECQSLPRGRPAAAGRRRALSGNTPAETEQAAKEALDEAVQGAWRTFFIPSEAPIKVELLAREDKKYVVFKLRGSGAALYAAVA